MTESEWNPWSAAPKDGRWIIACCWDGATIERVSWGRDRSGELTWCTADRSYGARSYGDGLFGGWIDCPQRGPIFIPDDDIIW